MNISTGYFQVASQSLLLMRQERVLLVDKTVLPKSSTSSVTRFGILHAIENPTFGFFCVGEACFCLREHVCALQNFVFVVLQRPVLLLWGRAIHADKAGSTYASPAVVKNLCLLLSFTTSTCVYSTLTLTL